MFLLHGVVVCSLGLFKERVNLNLKAPAVREEGRGGRVRSRGKGGRVRSRGRGKE